jgi:hypothetical protein
LKLAPLYPFLGQELVSGQYPALDLSWIERSMFYLSVFALLAIYGVITLGLTAVLHRMRIPSHWAIVLSFLIFGVAGGLLSAWQWPLDSITILNLPAALLGPAVYNWTIQYFGDPSSSQAHYSIPWLFRLPQVFILVSVIFWGLLGSLFQIVYNRARTLFEIRGPRSKP